MLYSKIDMTLLTTDRNTNRWRYHLVVGLNEGKLCHHVVNSYL